MPSINQLADEGAVIGYKPNLQYEKEKNVDPEVNLSDDNGEKTDKTGQIKYSNAVSSFLESNPSTALQRLEDTTILLKELVDKLTKSFKQGDWEEFGDISMFLSSLESGNNEFYQDFLEYHSSNPNGSIIPELIYQLFDGNKRIEELIGTFKELFYGKSNITLTEAIEYDAAHIARIRENEELGQYEKNNYLAISMDSMLCRFIGTHSFGINKKASKLARVGTTKDDSFATSTDRSVVKGLYDDVNHEISDLQKTYQSQNDVAIVKKALYNYYYKRRESIQLINLFMDSCESIIIGRKLSQKENELDEAVANIARTLKANELYMAKIAELEAEKRYVMNVYQRFSYNLDDT